MRRDPHPVATVLKVLLLLAAVDLLVRGPVLDRYVRPRRGRPVELLRDRTQAQAWSVLFDTLARATPPADVRIGLFGDSTVYQTDKQGDLHSMAFLLRQALRPLFPDRTIQIVDCSQLGLYASDSALLLNRALRHDVDLFVYGVTLRSLPRDPPTRWVTTLGSEIGPGELAQLVAVGAGPWLRETFPLDDLLAGLVHGTWATYGYRLELRHALWNDVVHPLVGRWPALAEALAPGPLYALPPLDPARDAPARAWTRAEYGPPNRNWDALDVVGRLCRRAGPERCLLYTGPLNPTALASVAPRDVYAEYRQGLRAVADRYGLDLRDYSDMMPAVSFRPRTIGIGPDPIHLNQGGGTLLGQWLAAALAPRVQARLDAAAR